MNPLTQFRIGTRLAFSFAALLALVLIMTATAVLQMRQSATLEAERAQLAEQATRIERWQGAVMLNLTRAMVAGASGFHPPTVAFVEPAMKETSTTITQLQAAIDKTLVNPDDRMLFDDVGVKRKIYLDVRAKAIAAFKDGKAEDGLQLVGGPMTVGAMAYLDAINKLQAHIQAEADALQVEASSRMQRSQTLLLVLAALAIAAGTAMAWAITRSIQRPLRLAVEAAQRIAANDLSIPVPRDGRADEFGELQVALSGMQTSLLKVIDQIRAGTVSVASASTEIASASIDLSQRTEETSGSLQQTASAMEEITATVNQTADSARMANQLAASACDVARRGGEVVGQVVSTMDSINASSKQISDIIGTIDGIAFQTNILALNAAVEAARAGEQGRGFAVVASEVRLLAQRSAEAAKQIKGLIGTSVARVDAGMRLVSDAGSTMSEIVSSVQRVSDIIGEVMAAAGEQRQGVAQVNDSVGTLDQMTQQNAALVEESAAAAESLKDQAARLSELLATFKLAGGNPAERAPALAEFGRRSTALRSAPAQLAKRHVAAKKTPVAPASPAAAAAVATGTQSAISSTASEAEAEWESF
jgi:methyl-accepting chemotaxis protein